MLLGAVGEPKHTRCQSPRYEAGLSSLNDIPHPPSKAGTTYVTGEASIFFTRPQELYYPLHTKDLPVGSPNNNLDVYVGYPNALYLFSSNLNEQ